MLKVMCPLAILGLVLDTNAGENFCNVSTVQDTAISLPSELQRNREKSLNINTAPQHVSIQPLQ